MTERSIPRHQLYGRRKGHALKSHQLRLMEELLPELRVDLATPVPSRRDAWLEIGFGGGEHLAHQAELHPDVNFIGADPFLNGVAKLLALIEAKNLANIRIHDGDARYLLEVLPDASLDRIYLLYPDPWPKVRHAKRRFVNAETLTHFHRLLKSAGLFLFASDIADYVAWTRKHVFAQGGFTETSNSTQPFENWIKTRYEAKAQRERRRTEYLRFQRNP